jgi:hypothetical protein
MVQHGILAVFKREQVPSWLFDFGNLMQGILTPCLSGTDVSKHVHMRALAIAQNIFKEMDSA